MKITDEERRSLHHVDYGLYQAYQNDTLDAVLRTQLIDSDPPQEAIDLLQRELSMTDRVSNYKYFEYLVCQLLNLLSLQSQYKDALKMVHQYTNESKSIRSIYVICNCMLHLGERETFTEVASLLSTNFHKYPITSKVLERFYLNKVFDLIYPSCKQISFEDLVTAFGNNHNLVISLVSYFQYKYDRTLTASLQNYIQHLNSKFAQYKFPKANEINNEIEDFVVTVCQNNELYHLLATRSLKEMVTTSFRKTFQNVKILKQYINLLVHEKRIDEIEPTFEVYMEYVEKSKDQHKGIYIDLLDIIDISTKALQLMIDSNRSSRLVFVEKLSAKLMSFMDVLVNDLALDYSHDGLSCMESKTDSLPKFSELVANAWYALGMTYRYFAINRSSSTKDLEDNLQQAVYYLQNCISSDTLMVPNYYFQLALIYAKMSKLKLSIKLTKLCCFNDKENFKYWNFLVLLYSTEENYKHAESIINNSIILMKAKLEDEVYVSNLSLEAKYDILELKMTQISLIELMNKDTSVALECLPELFFTFNKLFETQEQRLANDRNLTPMSSAKSKKSHTLKKLLTRTSNAPSRRQLPTAPVKQDLGHRPATIENRILQRLWLWTFNLYLKSGQQAEAENCLIEAEATYGTNSQTTSKSGMLFLSNNRLKLALKDFEDAIDKDEMNVAAVLQLSKLLLDTEDNEELFMNDADKESAQLRLRSILEKFQHNYSSCQITEVYWYLSMLYEIHQDFDLYQECLWKCVELEENKPVRNFKCLEGLYHNI